MYLKHIKCEVNFTILYNASLKNGQKNEKHNLKND